MKKIIFFLVLFSTLTFNHSFGQCSGGSSFNTVAAPTSGSTTMSSCNWAGDYNTITGVVAGSSYTVTSTGSACLTVHTGSSTGPVVAFGTSSVTFTAPSSGTYYVVINTNCSGCATGTTCLTTTVQFNSSGGGASAPCTSTTNIIGCGAAYTTSTTGASSVISSLCATATPGLESVYSYTATTTGAYSMNISSVTGGGYAIGYATACGTSGWTCVGTATTPSGSFGTINMTSGTTYYFLFDATSTAASSITFGLVCPPGGPTMAGDCAVAANVCSNASFAIDPNGYGTINEICSAGSCAANPSTNPSGSGNSGCLISGELNSTWMVVNVLTGGNLTFSMGTPGSSNWYCLDWAMWPYNSSACAAIQAGTLAPVRCNYNGACEEFTGLASSLPAGATSMTNWEPPLAVGSSTQYLICLSNYSSAVTSIPLSFGGTAVISCSPLGAETMTTTGEAMSGYNIINWTSSAEFNAAYYSIQRSLDGQNYEEIGQMDAIGLSMEELNYRFEDLQPANGINYYRIVMIHQNESEIVSNEVVVTQKFMHDAEVIRTYPNPAKDQLNMVLYASKSSEYQVEITALNGTAVFKSNYQISNGLNADVIDISTYETGFYLMKVYDQDKLIATHKIIIE